MKPALLLVDLQGDYLASRGLQPAAENLIGRTAALLAACRQRHIPVIHVWTTIHRDDDRRLPHWKKSNRWQCVTGTAGHKTPASLQPLANETVIHKSGFNAFANPALDAALKKMKCDAVVVAGLHLHTCVRTVAAESLERGLQIFIADDAVASDDPVYAAATRRWLAARGVEFISAGEIRARLGGNAPSKLLHRSPRETKKILFEIPVAGGGEIAAKTLSAQTAWKKWRRTSVSSRAEILRHVAKGLDAAAPKLARDRKAHV